MSNNYGLGGTSGQYLDAYNKSLNKLYKDSGTSLSFKDWLAQEEKIYKERDVKINFLDWERKRQKQRNWFQQGSNVVSDLFGALTSKGGSMEEETLAGADYQADNRNLPKKTKILGVSKPVAIGVGFAVAGVIGYGIYSMIKKSRLKKVKN